MLENTASNSETKSSAWPSSLRTLRPFMRATANPIRVSSTGGLAEAVSLHRNARSEFVKQVHDDACGTFETVLGPEANEAHKNHFHLDMKERRSAFCQ